MAMTRDEFIENINNFSELEDFCCDNGYEDYIGDVVSSETRDEFIDDHIVDWARENTWEDLYYTLSRERDDNGYDLYIWDDYDYRYRPLDDSDIDELKENLLDRLDSDGFWDTEEEEEEEVDLGEYHYDPSQYADEPETKSAWRKDSVNESDDSDDFDITNDEGLTVVDIINAGIGCLRQIKETGNDGDDCVFEFPL